MDRIKIISASAGSGKTYRLTEILEKEVVEARRVRPDAVLATTFTNKAAAELRDRAYQRLLASGRTEDARRLGASRIGTVHAICGGIVSEFAFELGLSPDLRVLDEVSAEEALRNSLSSVITREMESRFADLEGRMGGGRSWKGGEKKKDEAPAWMKDVRKVVDLARQNALKPEDLELCRARSLDSFRVLMPQVAEDGDALDAALLEALRTIDEPERFADDSTKKTAESLSFARQCQSKLEGGNRIAWSDWAKLAKHGFAKKSQDFAAPLYDAAGAHERHPRLLEDVKESIDLLFGLAAAALRSYADHKRTLGIIDFNDQEILCLKLLEREDVRERLERDVELVLVDEFHDTSPIQLAIFVKLAEIAPRSIWVGDQKQSIYAFRGADPALMESVIESVLDGDEPETLPRSYRSRPGLVRVTSILFGKAFEPQGIPPSRVHLDPALKAEPPGLGPEFERWVLDAGNVEEGHAALATIMKELLEDRTVMVRDRGDGETRPARPGDVAVLCRKNETCDAVAEELNAKGIRTAIPRAGLLSTPEGIASLAALRLWHDPRDTLAMAELARLSSTDGDALAWMESLISEGARSAFSESPIVRQILESRERSPLSGPVDSLDRSIEAAGIRELCLRWGDDRRRIGNLETLRTHAVAYEVRCAESTMAFTTGGLIVHLSTLADEGEDAQAVMGTEDEVVVSTWHGAKGLEWPITVLYELGSPPKYWPFGVKVQSDAEKVTLAAPLEGRWIRHWPYPYGGLSKGLAIFDRACSHQTAVDGLAEACKQELRLLYVGWTRARDRLVLAGPAGCLSAGILAHLKDGTSPLLSEPDQKTGDATWADEPVRVKVRKAGPSERIEPDSPIPGEAYITPGPSVHPPATLIASEIDATGSVSKPESIGNRIEITGEPEMSDLGNAIHGFLAADRPGIPEERRVAVAERLLGAWRVSDSIQSKSLLATSDVLRTWVESRWENAVWYREWPVSMRMENGSDLHGIADLVLETPDGFIVIDHKSFPGNAESAARKASGFAGQVQAYASAIQMATGKPVLGIYIHLPVSGMVIEVISDI